MSILPKSRALRKVVGLINLCKKSVTITTCVNSFNVDYTLSVPNYVTF